MPCTHNGCPAERHPNAPRYDGATQPPSETRLAGSGRQAACNFGCNRRLPHVALSHAATCGKVAYVVSRTAVLELAWLQSLATAASSASPEMKSTFSSPGAAKLLRSKYVSISAAKDTLQRAQLRDNLAWQCSHLRAVRCVFWAQTHTKRN